eukprot:364185-Chlamydomonas_euryale.AAC.9
MQSIKSTSSRHARAGSRTPNVPRCTNRQMYKQATRTCAARTARYRSRWFALNFPPTGNVRLMSAV